jgi:SAM-dependent methyltransferase
MAERGDAAYVIATGVTAVDRLELLTEVFAPVTDVFLRRLGRINSFLDVGCGLAPVAEEVRRSGASRVMAVDINPEVVAAARQRTSVDCDVASIEQLGQGALTGFEVVYARCLLSHLPDPSVALASMVAAGMPGGRIAIEDVQVSRVWSSPALPALERHAELYVRAARARGASPEVAPQLAGHLREAGLTDVELTVLQPLLPTARARSIHAMTMHAIGPAAVGAGLCTADEVDELTAALADAADTGTWQATLPLVVQVSGRIPA